MSIIPPSQVEFGSSNPKVSINSAGRLTGAADYPVGSAAKTETLTAAWTDPATGTRWETSAELTIAGQPVTGIVIAGPTAVQLQPFETRQLSVSTVGRVRDVTHECRFSGAAEPFLDIDLTGLVTAGEPDDLPRVIQAEWTDPDTGTTHAASVSITVVTPPKIAVAADDARTFVDSSVPSFYGVNGAKQQLVIRDAATGTDITSRCVFGPESGLSCTPEGLVTVNDIWVWSPLFLTVQAKNWWEFNDYRLRFCHPTIYDNQGVDLELAVGQQFQVAVTLYYTGEDVTSKCVFTSNNPGMEVSETGLVTAVSEGWGSIEYRYTLPDGTVLTGGFGSGVILPPEPPLRFVPDTLVLGVGYMTGVIIYDAHDRDLTYSAEFTSSNPAVVDCWYGGTIVGAGLGEATVTANVAGLTAELPVSVVQMRSAPETMTVATPEAIAALPKRVNSWKPETTDQTTEGGQ